MHEWYRSPPVDFPPPENSDLDISSETHQEVRRNYAAMVEHLDQCVGRLVEELERRGELEETLIVFSSDHGEMLGDHGQWQKLSPLQASVGVPLVVAGPNIPDQNPITDPATILDLHSTFLDYAGVAVDSVESRSMREAWEGNGDVPRDVVYSGLSSWRMVYDGQYKLIKGYDPTHRTGGEFEPMLTAQENAERRRQERETVLHEVHRSENENVADEHPDVVERLETAMNQFLQGERVSVE
jgi:arylsulfatase A-like enzyme